MNKQEIPNELKKRLEEFQVKVPNIQTKKSRLDRLTNWIYAPARNPLEVFNIKVNSFTRVVFYPLILILVLFFTPIFFI
ncbi:hypothetical protein ACDX78_17910 [Virgibacillus oceani]